MRMIQASKTLTEDDTSRRARLSNMQVCVSDVGKQEHTECVRHKAHPSSRYSGESWVSTSTIGTLRGGREAVILGSVGK